MHSNFTAHADPLFQKMKIHDRLDWTNRAFPGTLAATSSFGIQSILLIKHLDDARIKIPVVSVDIAGAEYDAQRRYRDRLERYYAFDLHVFPAADEGEKIQALQEGLTSLGIAATIDGIRRQQTEIRKNKPFIELKKDSRIAVHPFLDWADGRVDLFLLQTDLNLVHPNWQPGVQSKGGRILPRGVVKDECGLHTVSPV